MKTQRLILTLGTLAPGLVALSMFACSAGDTSSPKNSGGSTGSGGNSSGSGGSTGTGGDSTGSGGSTGTGGDSTGSGGTTGSGGSTGSGGTTGSGGGSTGACAPGVTQDTTPAVKPAGDDLDLIDMGDTKWWVGASAMGTYTPTKSPPAPMPTMDGTRTVFHMTGSGLGANDYGTLDFSPTPGMLGGEPTDMSAGTGITFDAKGDPKNFWVLVGTADTNGRFCKCAGANFADCYIGYRFQVTTVNATDYTPVTVKWTDLALPTWVTRHPVFDATKVVSLSFGGIGTAATFDVSIDNLKLAH
jgi:hypothetical protein